MPDLALPTTSQRTWAKIRRHPSDSVENVLGGHCQRHPTFYGESPSRCAWMRLRQMTGTRRRSCTRRTVLALLEPSNPLHLLSDTLKAQRKCNPRKEKERKTFHIAHRNLKELKATARPPGPLAGLSPDVVNHKLLSYLRWLCWDITPKPRSS